MNKNFRLLFEVITVLFHYKTKFLFIYINKHQEKYNHKKIYLQKKKIKQNKRKEKKTKKRRVHMNKTKTNKTTQKKRAKRRKFNFVFFFIYNRFRLSTTKDTRLRIYSMLTIDIYKINACFLF